MSPSTRIRLLVSCTALPYWALMMLLIWTRRDLGMPEQWAYSAAPTLVCWGSWFGMMALSRQMQIDERRREGLCLACGYDLRASKGVCPECGMPRGTLSP
jgi:hypothetical protein